MATQNKGKPLPKFGEWDVNNPASAEGFTVIFSKASDEKKTKKASGADRFHQEHRFAYLNYLLCAEEMVLLPLTHTLF
ncbi:unnamed protein product [Cochlearia groenlandica]